MIYIGFGMRLMKYLLIAFLFICCVSKGFAQVSSKEVNLKGHLKNFNNAVQVENYSEFQYLLPITNERMIVPDSAGNFQINFPLNAPNYFRIGRNVLYLTPGDNMVVFIDFYDPALATFKGRGSSANLYLRGTPFPKGGSFMDGGKNVKATPQQNIDMILNEAAKRNEELTQLKNVSKEFKRLEIARTKADVINSIQMAQFYCSYMLKLNGDKAKEFIEKLKNLSGPLIEKYSLNFVDAFFLKLVVYRDIADQLIKQSKNTPDEQKIKDWLTATALVNEMQKENDKNKLTGLLKQINSIKTVSYKNAADKFLERSLAFGKGDYAADFTAMDLNGNNVKLSQLKGKIIYVDLWATWCGPCMAEMPHFEKLKQQFQADSNIKFISLSIDDSIDAWKKSVNARNANGYQWQINRNELNAYNVVYIPRTLIIDKNFKMINMNAPLPSSEESGKIIDELLK